MVRRRDGFIRKGKYFQAKNWANRTPTLYRSFTQHLPLTYLYIMGFSGAWYVCCIWPKLGMVSSLSPPTGFFLDVNLVLTLSDSYSAATIRLSCLKTTESICESKKWSEDLCGEAVLTHRVLKRQKWGWVVSAWVSHTCLGWAFLFVHELPILSLY